ncbi:hypothetical protein [Roseomonas xinghualingensis]|uniref:hypothetical protein n=1 Tax=Roseomonas xinghualingensis TaxID=2986475 RepID=UPI0021F13855|nr:hypothetical protein [Roseomonas sp. SXEYE001]MCV4210345.1 hypothetical protein [Roseomonas sp. SXEYE001]
MTTRTEPQVGIFWLAQDGRGPCSILTRGCTLPEAEEYGDCLTFAEGHYETWEVWRDGNLSLEPASQHLRRVITKAEYEEWPRGRVVYERPTDLFVVYADRQAFPHRALIEARFSLPAGRTAMRTDLHYRSTRRLSAAPEAPA